MGSCSWTQTGTGDNRDTNTQLPGFTPHQSQRRRVAELGPSDLYRVSGPTLIRSDSPEAMFHEALWQRSDDLRDFLSGLCTEESASLSSYCSPSDNTTSPISIRDPVDVVWLRFAKPWFSFAGSYIHPSSTRAPLAHVLSSDGHGIDIRSATGSW
jgi:hypothetical protein